jgi:hypothetical protein
MTMMMMKTKRRTTKRTKQRRTLEAKTAPLRYGYSCPVLSCPVLSCPVLSYPVLSYPILSYLPYLVLSCPTLSCPVQSFYSTHPIWVELICYACIWFNLYLLQPPRLLPLLSSSTLFPLFTLHCSQSDHILT